MEHQARISLLTILFIPVTYNITSRIHRTLCLCFKTSLRAKPFISKCVPPSRPFFHANQRPCSHLVPEHWCPSTGTKCGYVQTLGAQNVRMFTFNKPSTCSPYSNRGDRNMHAFRVRYCCLIIAFFTFLMLCLYMKHASDDMDYDDRGWLARSTSLFCSRRRWIEA